MIRYTDPVEYFKLRPIKAAKVSEVSEATASSSVPAEEKVNFHIGNPVQDKRLSSAYLRMILGIDFQNEDQNETTSIIAYKGLISFLVLEKIPLLVLTMISICLTFYAAQSVNTVASSNIVPLT